MRELTAVFAGGAAGALARTGLAEGLPVTAASWPWATLAANLTGCLLLGVVLTRSAAGSARRGLLGPGLCGGLTTFSTLQLELVELAEGGSVALAAAYAAASVVLGLVAIDAGRRLAAPRR